MNLKDVNAALPRHKRRRRVGRGPGSGTGKTSGKGHKGLKARRGAKIHLTYEGGQMPLFRRLPKRGFNNANFRIEYGIVNLSDLESYADGETVNLERLHKDGRVPKSASRLKLLGDGELSKNLVVEAHRFSKSAREKLEQAGGTAKVVE